MSRHPVYGRYSHELGWVPAPRYLLRRHRIIELVRTLPRGELLEIGCGAGALLADLAQEGLQCSALDYSLDAVAIAKAVNSDSPEIDIRDKADTAWDERFDIVVAFEVLEHQENDIGALQQWAGWLRQEGHMMVSVPAHPDRWNASDVWAGHYRRYEKEGLAAAFRAAGLQVLSIECYGFPLANMMEPLRARYRASLMKSEQRRKESSKEQKIRDTRRSGIERPMEVKYFELQAGWLGTRAMRLAIWLQDFFLEKSWGNGYIALARKL